MNKAMWLSFQKVMEQQGVEPEWHGWAGLGHDSFYWIKFPHIAIGIEEDGYAHS